MAEDFELWCGNISFNADEREVREFFEQAGCVLEVRLIHSPDLESHKGFGFVKMADETSYRKALGLHDQFFSGRKIKITEAWHSPRRGSGSGRSYRFGQNY